MKPIARRQRFKVAENQDRGLGPMGEYGCSLPAHGGRLGDGGTITGDFEKETPPQTDSPERPLICLVAVFTNEPRRTNQRNHWCVFELVVGACM